MENEKCDELNDDIKCIFLCEVSDNDEHMFEKTRSLLSLLISSIQQLVQK